MASLHMSGPYPLTTEDIDNRIPIGSIGNYAYGYLDEKNVFRVQYVGRSDTDLNDRIKHGVGQYKLYKFSLAETVKDAFEKECRNYHDFGENRSLDNAIHPDKPENKNYKCPVCEQ